MNTQAYLHETSAIDLLCVFRIS